MLPAHVNQENITQPVALAARKAATATDSCRRPRAAAPPERAHSFDELWTAEATAKGLKLPRRGLRYERRSPICSSLDPPETGENQRDSKHENVAVKTFPLRADSGGETHTYAVGSAVHVVHNLLPWSMTSSTSAKIRA